MKSIKNLSLRFTSIFFIILTFILLAGCASTTNTSKGSGLAPAAAPDLQSLPELTSVPAFSLPPEALPGIPYSCKLSDMPSSADLKKISVVSPKVYKWQPEEYFMDVYVYEKATEKYIACIKNCYQQSIAKWQWGNLGTVWAVWAKDDAVYLLSPSDYILCNKNGMRILTGYLAETAFSKARLNLGTPGWQPEGELCNFYLYSKKENKFVAYIKDCWRNSLWLGSKGWGGYVKNAYQIMDTNRQMYLIEASDYLICNEEGYEYINGWLAKTDFDKLMVSYGQLGWQPQGETRDYYLYSKKQKQIVTCIKDCWRTCFYYGLKGWDGNVKNAYRLITTDGKQYLAESSEYIIQEKIDDRLIDAYSPDIKVSLSTNKLEAGKKITVSATGVKNKYLFIYGFTEDKKYFSSLKRLEGGESRKTSIIIPFTVDKIAVGLSNQADRWDFSCYESNLINKTAKDGRIFQIPASYEKANKYRKAAPDQRVVDLVNDSELEGLRLTNPDAYLDEIIKRINKMGFDDYGRVTAIHDFIANLVCYDHDSVYEKYEYTDENGVLKTAEREKAKSEAKTQYNEVLQCRKTSCAGYSALFYEMCCRADIVCEIVGGYARGFLWKPEDDVNKSNHAWNAVMLDGVWYLIDNTWDAGSETGGVRRVMCTHNWLFTPPEEFLPTHFPTNSELQMIKKPVSADAFKNTTYSNPKL